MRPSPSIIACIEAVGLGWRNVGPVVDSGAPGPDVIELHWVVRLAVKSYASVITMY